MADPLILALDQGTTSTRAILFDAKGEALAESGRPLVAAHEPCPQSRTAHRRLQCVLARLDRA